MRRVDSPSCGGQSNPKSYKEPIGCFFPLFFWNERGRHLLNLRSVLQMACLVSYTIVDLVNIRRNVAERWLQRWKVQRWLQKCVLKIFPLENRLERIFQFSGLNKPFPIKATIDGFENLSSSSIDDSLEGRYVGCQNLYSFIHNTCYIIVVASLGVLQRKWTHFYLIDNSGFALVIN